MTCNPSPRYYKWLFIICILIRALFVYASYAVDTQTLQYFAIPAFFISLYFVNQIMKSKPCGAFNQKVWWNNMRYIHALLYFLFGIFALTKNDDSWVILLTDISIGIFAFSIKHVFYNS